jgi:hypothetical protein
MPLIETFKTDLKSLRFGQDRPGGGSSGQPFHTPNYRKKFELGTSGLAQTGGPDMFLRGGYLTPGRILADEERLLKLFSLTPQGLLFTPQQNQLSQVGTRLQAGYPAIFPAANFSTSGKGLLNQGVYLPTSTLAQAAVNPFGGHLDKQGTNPRVGGPKYMDLVNPTLGGTQFGLSDVYFNRLLNFYRSKIINPNGSTSTELYTYNGGPGSDLGLSGKTVINTASDRTRFKGTLSDYYVIGSNALVQWNPISYSTFSQEQLSNADVVGNTTTTVVQDFRKELLKNINSSSNLSKSPNYTRKNIERRVFLNNPGQRGVNRINYTTGRVDLPTGLDEINSLYLYKSEAVTADPRKNDLVKFRIAIIDNNNPTQKTFAHFRAFINSFTDNIQSEWDSFKYLGRGENFYNYRGFTRSNQMSFSLAAQSKPELSIMYQKLNYIVSSLTPNYSGGGYMRGNLAQLTLGGYFYEMPGIIDNIAITIPEDSTWEIGINTDGGFDSSVKELPHRLEISMQFTPLHNFLPELVKDINGGESISQRFLSLEDDGDKNNLYNNSGKGVPAIFKPKGRPTLSEQAAPPQVNTIYDQFNRALPGSQEEEDILNSL